MASMLLVLGCAPEPQRPTLKEQIAGTAAPTAEMRNSILAQSHAYWLALADERHRDAFAFHTEDYKERVPFAKWQSQSRNAIGAAPRPVLIRWTQAAHRHQGPELYAILRWAVADRENRSTGTLIWRQDYDGQFRLENAE